MACDLYAGSSVGYVYCMNGSQHNSGFSTTIARIDSNTMLAVVTVGADRTVIKVLAVKVSLSWGIYSIPIFSAILLDDSKCKTSQRS